MLDTHTRRALGGVLAAFAIALMATAFALSERPARAATLATVTASGTTAATATFSGNDQTGNVGDVLPFAWSSGLHTATAVGGQFDFDLNSTGDVGSYTFVAADAGTTVWYYCTIHAAASDADAAGLAAGDMVGRVVVAQQAATATPTATSTSTSTATPTSTSTATPTVTGTLTATPTSTSTATATPTATAPAATSTPTTAAPTATRTATAAATTAPAPPATGSGTVGGTDTALLLMIAGFGAVALTGGTLIAIRKRS